MVSTYHRGMRTGGMKSAIRTKYREPRAKEAWPASRIFNGERYQLHTTPVKGLPKEDVKRLRKTKKVRHVKSKKARFGHLVNIATGPDVSKNAYYTREKELRMNRKRKNNLKNKNRKKKK